MECKALAVESVNAHLAPIRERRHELAQNPARLRETIQHGAQKATAAAEETMVAVRDAIGLLRLGAVELAAKDESTAALRVPESIACCARDDEERWEIITAAWLEQRIQDLSSKKRQATDFHYPKRKKSGRLHGRRKNSGRVEVRCSKTVR